MAFVALSGNDTIIVNGTILTGSADGNIAELTFPNEIANVKTGKNGNTIYGLNESGRQSELKLRVIRGSDDDKFMQGLLNAQQADFASFPLMIGTLVKRIGTTTFSQGQGPATPVNDTYALSGGIFTKPVEAKSNVEGDTEQSVSVYMMKFANVSRTFS